MFDLKVFITGANFFELVRLLKEALTTLRFGEEFIKIDCGSGAQLIFQVKCDDDAFQKEYDEWRQTDEIYGGGKHDH